MALTALTGACSSWTGPPVAVEDRGARNPDRPRAASKAAAVKASQLTKKPQREERQTAKEQNSLNAKSAKGTKESPGTHASADAMSGDLILEMKPEKR